MLRSAGVTLALPILESFAGELKPVRRLVCICAPLGLHPEFFFPGKSGRDYALSPYLETVKDLREDFTVISGLAHPGVGSSHDSIFSFLTGARHPENRAGFRNSISLDQFAADKIGTQTRFPSLSLTSEGFSLSWTSSGAMVPAENWPGSVFARMFLEGRPDEVLAQARRLSDGLSILDTVREQASRLQPKLGARDREKVDEYFTSVRELEQRMTAAREWSKKPKPKVDVEPMQNNMNSADLIGKARLMFDLSHLALQTDSTRIITMMLLGTSSVPPIQGVTMGHHDLSHHGQDATKIAQLRVVETELMRVVGEFLTKLRNSQEQGGSVLDGAQVYFGSNLGNASNHSTKNMPVLLTGGGWKHGQHLSFPGDETPLSNLYLSMLHRMGIEAERFGSSTGTLRGLEMHS